MTNNKKKKLSSKQWLEKIQSIEPNVKKTKKMKDIYHEMLNMFFTIPIEVGLKYIKETNSQNDIEEGKQLTGIQKYLNDQKTYKDDKQ
jgi:hypothetical protein